MAKSPVDAQINQNITNTIMLLEMLTVQADQKPIYACDLGALQDQVNAMQNQIKIVMEERNAAEAAICLLRTELAEARNVANALAHATPAAAAAATATATAAPAPKYTVDKIPFPDKFNGTRSKLRAFTTQLRLKVVSFPDEQSRLRLAINCLAGEAMDQVQQYVKADRVDLDNVEVLIDILEEAFGNPNRMAEVEAKLCSLQQGNREFTSYYAEFQQYASELKWDETAKLSTLRRGLAYCLQNDLVTVDKELETIAAFMALCNKLDTKCCALQGNSRSHDPCSQAPKHTLQATPASATETAATSFGTAPGPMNLSANRCHLSLEERARRLAEGHCYRCGGMGHMARACPLSQ